MVGTIRRRVRSRSSMRVSTRKLAATFWKMNEMPLSEVMEKKELQSENLSVVLSASVSHSTDHAPGVSRTDRFIPRSHQSRLSESLERKHLEPTVRVVADVDQRSSASSMETEISYRARTPREPIVGFRTRLKDVNNALVTSKELLKIIDRNLAHNDQLTSCMSLVSALHSELERACQQVNQLIREQQAVEMAIESIAGELKAERRLRYQYESLNNKLDRELSETKITLTNRIKELASDNKARKRTEKVCHKLALDISHEQFEREHEILQLSGRLGEKKVHRELLECKDHFDEKNGVVERLRNQFEAFFKSNKSEKRNCNKITTYSSRTHSRSNKNEERECSGEVGNSSAESDLHSIELNMDKKRGSFRWIHASTAARDSLSTDDETRARKYISETVQNKSNYIQGSVSDGFQRGIRAGNTPSSVNLLQQKRCYRPGKKSQTKGDNCELLRQKSVKDLKDKILSNYSLGSGGEFSSPIQELTDPLHSQYIGHVKQIPRLKQRLSTKSRLGEIGAEQRRISRHFVE
ncbi:hypothetical protein DCAR_0417618 [Daucus carota subsp. sativus]|uniref:Uncharacterized protein n=2 Tax=Daucus carota subsp. sativus TaxID=79200 RepID=A0AAF0WYP7_DAUCS|nr:hypothetical protein DCAR_0417618 [Daucus carota subsp. sativus]